MRWAAAGSVALALVLAACGGSPPAPAPAPSPAKTPGSPPAVAPPVGSTVRLAPPTTSRNWNELKLQAARRMVAATPNGTYAGEPPEVLLAIPVLQIELNADGSVRHIDVMRKPSGETTQDTIQLAIDAVRRGAPYGDVSRLPKPWKFSETFLFNDDRRFKPRTLDAL